MVAVPKNQALTMLLGGTVGFDANVAGYDNGQIVLGAGWSIYDAAGTTPLTAIGNDSSISFGPGDYKSDIFAIATGTIQALASTGDIAFGGDIDFETFYGPNTASIILGADGDYSLTVAGDVHFWAQAADVQSITQIYAANSGTVDISGGVQMNASPSNNATGGSASLSADDGLLKITGNVYMSVDDYYFAAATTDKSAGTVYGGEINVTASNEGTITTGGLHLSANGTGQTATGGYEYSEHRRRGRGRQHPHRRRQRRRHHGRGRPICQRRRFRRRSHR